MATDWQPSGAWKAKFRKALLNVFDNPSMELLTADYFPPENLFSNIAPPSLGLTYESRLFQLIEQARMNGWLIDLVAAAHERRPNDSALTAIAEERGLTISGPRMDNPTTLPLEKIIQVNAKMINPAIFDSMLPKLEGQVCWIDIPGGGGTGFLVGPDLLLTNAHVITDLQSGAARWQDVKCRFDYKQDINGVVLAQKSPSLVGLAENWLVDQHPPSQFDFNPALGDAGAEEADCALLRLAEAIGDLPVGGDTADSNVAARGWIDAQLPAPAMAKGNQVFLLQHPEGKPLQLAIGTVTEFNNSGTRMRYDANSKNGSSGSPCFNADLQLVALHHAHDLAEPPKWNEAIPFAVIQKLWETNNIEIPKVDA